MDKSAGRPHNTADLSATIKTRKGRKEDLDGIFALCDGVFDDLDVFPYLFTLYVSSPNMMVYVAEDPDGHIVGCLSAVVLDNGTTFFMGSARTVTAMEGRGVQHKLRQACWLEAYTHNRFPKLRDFIRGISVHTDFVDARGSKLSKVLFTQLLMLTDDAISPATLQQITSPQSIHRLSATLPVDKLESVSPDQFQQLLMSSETCKHLFPYDMVCNHSEMFELMEENIAYIYTGRGDTHVVGMPLSKRERNDACEQMMGVRYESLSLALALQCKRGWSLELTYFGVDDLDTIIAHVIKQLSLLTETKGLGVYLCCALHKDLFRDTTITGIVRFLQSEARLNEIEILQQYFLNIVQVARPSSML